jgi:hypothetical protein
MEEKATLKGMLESHNELITEIGRESRLDRLGEDAEDEEEDKDANDGGDAAALPVPTPPTTLPEKINDEGPVEMVPEQEALVAHEVILANAKPKVSQPRLFHALMRDYEESPPRTMDDLDDLNDDPNEGRSDMDEWFPKDWSNDRD